MDCNLFLSSNCSSRKFLVEAARELASFGANNIELSGNLIWYKELAADLEKLARKQYKFILHNYFPPLEGEDFVLNFASNAPGQRDMAFTLAKRALELTSKFNLPLYGIHPGFRADMSSRIQDYHFAADEASMRSPGEALESFYSNLSKIMEEPFSLGCKIAVENLFPLSKEKSYSLMTTPEEIEEFLNYSLRYENLGFLLDLGHLNVSAGIYGFNAKDFAGRILSAYPQKVFEIHVSDNDGRKDKHLANNADSWQCRIIKEYAHTTAKIPVILEWYNEINGTRLIAERFHSIAAYLA